jgi:hypothetical protein
MNTVLTEPGHTVYLLPALIHLSHVPSLYQCVETRSMEVFLTVVSTTFAPPFQLLRHQRNVCRPVVKLYATSTSHWKRKSVIMNILCIEPFCPQKRTTERCYSVVYSSSLVAILTTEASFWRCACASATWTVLLPSDTLKTCYVRFHLWSIYITC